MKQKYFAIVLASSLLAAAFPVYAEGQTLEAGDDDASFNEEVLSDNDLYAINNATPEVNQSQIEGTGASGERQMTVIDAGGNLKMVETPPATTPHASEHVHSVNALPHVGPSPEPGVQTMPSAEAMVSPGNMNPQQPLQPQPMPQPANVSQQPPAMGMQPPQPAVPTQPAATMPSQAPVPMGPGPVQPSMQPPMQQPAPQQPSEHQPMPPAAQPPVQPPASAQPVANGMAY